MTKGLYSLMFKAGSLQTKLYSYYECAITKHGIVFFEFLELFMNIVVRWGQLPNPPMVSVIIVCIKGTNTVSKLL